MYLDFSRSTAFKAIVFVFLRASNPREKQTICKFGFSKAFGSTPEECNCRCDSLVSGIKDIVFTGVFYLMLTRLIIRLYALQPTIIKHSLGRNTRMTKLIYSSLEQPDQHAHKVTPNLIKKFRSSRRKISKLKTRVILQTFPNQFPFVRFAIILQTNDYRVVKEKIFNN